MSLLFCILRVIWDIFQKNKFDSYLACAVEAMPCDEKYIKLILLYDFIAVNTPVKCIYIKIIE
jgi:hypothetical protein